MTRCVLMTMPNVRSLFDKIDPQRTARAVWISLAIALALKAVVAPLHHTTYPCFEAGTLCWWGDRDMYDYEVCRYEYRYSPTFAVLFTPFAMLPTWCGGLSWSLLNVGVLYATLRVLVRDIFPTIWSPRQQSLFLLLVAAGTARSLWAGQSNTLVFSLVALGVGAIIRQRWWMAALLLSLPVYIKVWPIAAALLLVACWPRALVARFTVTMMALAAVPFLTRPFAIVLGHYRVWIEALIGPMQVRHIYRDFWTIWETVHPPVDPRAYMLLQLATAAVVLALCLWGRWKFPTDRHALTQLLGLWTAWQLLFGPGTERNTICLIAPLTTWALVASFDARRGRVLTVLAFALTTLFSFGVFERWLQDAFPAILTAIPVGVLLFAVWLVLMWGRHSCLPSGHSRQECLPHVLETHGQTAGRY